MDPGDFQRSADSPADGERAGAAQNSAAGDDRVNPVGGTRIPGKGAVPNGDVHRGPGAGGGGSEDVGAGMRTGRSGKAGTDGRRELLRYAGLSGEVFGSIGISVFLGIKADKWLHVSFPILAWLLPLLVIVMLTIKLVKESSKKNNGK